MSTNPQANSSSPKWLRPIEPPRWTADYEQLLTEWRSAWEKAIKGGGKTFELIRQFEHARNIIALIHNVPTGLLPLPAEIDRLQQAFRETPLGQILESENDHWQSAAYWFEKLEGHPLTVESAVQYLCARHGMTQRQAESLSIAESIGIFRNDFEARRGLPDMTQRPEERKMTPTPQVDALLEVATREYAASQGTFWLAAFPVELQLERCREHDPASGTIAAGRVALPCGGLCFLGTVDVKDHGATALVAFSLPARSTEEMGRFRSFAADAGATLVACLPSWAQSLTRPGDPATTWVAALMFLAPGAAGCIAEKPGGCWLITQPWAVSVAALREWDSTAPEAVLPADTTDGQAGPTGNDPQAPNNEADAGPDRKGKRINERMLARLQREPGSLSWSAQQWADALGCSKSTIAETPTWKKTLRTAKALERTERETRQERNQGRSEDA